MQNVNCAECGATAQITSNPQEKSRETATMGKKGWTCLQCNPPAAPDAPETEPTDPAAQS
jgi:hypothetical protein